MGATVVDAGSESHRWLRHYPDGLPAETGTRHGNVLDYFRDSVAGSPAAEAIRYFDASISFADLDGLSDGLAAWLTEQGVPRGGRVGIVLQNVPHFAIAVLAAWKLGAIPVPGNPMYRAGELARIFADYGPGAVICHDDHLAETREALAEAGLSHVAVATACAHDFQTLGDRRLLPERVAAMPETDLLAICAARRGNKPAPIALEPGETGLILYTSGTTGIPKGAINRHESLAFNAEVGVRWTGMTARSRLLALAPLFHITGFTLHMGFGFVAGCSMALQCRFEPQAILDVIRAYRPTITVAAITAYNALMNCPGVTSEDFACFEQTYTGGAPVAPALRDQVRSRLGIDLRPAYGLTESAGQTHHTPNGAVVPVHAETGALAVGIPICSTMSKIVGEDGAELPPGEAGEIWIKGPQIMSGYWNKPEESAHALHDGWLRTGDIGVMCEQGWFYIVDRMKDMIIASGFKVWPREVEDVLLAHPAVREAAVVGTPDDYRGESVVAFISRKADAEVDEAALIAHCRDRLAVYKAPRRVIFLDELPKTPTGKIQRAVMRAQLQAGS
jgi:long-chain acyl-CoA synthetase